jgi:hypothetical protein
MAICHLFIYKNLNLKLQITNPIDKILSLSFDLRYLKVNIYYIERNHFAKDYQKDSNKKIILKKITRIKTY